MRGRRRRPVPCSITKANVKVLEDGDKWLIYNRKKTGTLARVKLLPEALELMAKYEVYQLMTTKLSERVEQAS